MNLHSPLLIGLFFFGAVELSIAQNVGIGSNNPLEKLDVNGDLLVRGQDIYTSHDATTNTDNDYISYDDAASTALGGVGIFHLHADQARAGTWQLPTASISARGAYFAGRVGIGTDTPDESLELTGGGIQINGEFGIGFLGDIPYDGNVTDDRAKIYYDNDYIGTYNDYLVFEKTDANNTVPDGGFVFTMKGNSNTRIPALTIFGNSRIGLQTVINPTYAFELPNSTAAGNGSARAYAWATYSDGRLKDNRKTIPYGLQTVLQLNPVAYQHHNSNIDETGQLQIQPTSSSDIGFIAQELVTKIPEVVYRPSDETKDLWAVDYMRLIPILTKAIQEQQDIIKNLEKQQELLQKEIDRIKTEQSH